ncbi:MAG: hypothetical protein AB7L65_03105 [Hyphomonadaceae bacterium]
MFKKTAQESPPRPGGTRAASLEAELAAAEADLAAGDIAEAERRAKAVGALARAARDVAELKALQAQQPEEEDIEEIRAELERRLFRFLECDRESRLPPEFDDPPREGVA